MKTQATGIEFELDAEPDAPLFELESPAIEADTQERQAELYLPEQNPEQPDTSPQQELAGMAPPRYRVELANGPCLHFQHASSLLESLEAQGVDINYQCREGYCGSCRVQLLQGEVHYTLEPLAWLNDGEVLTCCSIPKTHLKIKIER